MTYDAFSIVRDFEAAVAEYTGAPHVVAVNSCTNALFLALKWHWRPHDIPEFRAPIEIPKRTYISVPMQILHAGRYVDFRDEDWTGTYQLKPTHIWDCARRFTSGMYQEGQYQCVSFHWSKILGIQTGGAILHDDPEADAWLRRARYDGRTEGVPPSEDTFKEVGWHMYMTPEIAAEGLVRLEFLPRDNPDLPPDDYPDLSKFKFLTKRPTIVKMT
jgi:dTDP-4-amino-4,6-dideoxygalactose transaminase